VVEVYFKLSIEPETAFSLLPNESNHDFQIFFDGPYYHETPRHGELFEVTQVSLEFFVGRQLSLFKVLLGLKHSKIVEVFGPSGVGKSSLVRAVGSYVRQRYREFGYHHIVRLPLSAGMRENIQTDFVQELTRTLNGRDDDNSSFSELIGRLRDKKSLFILDGKDSNLDEWCKSKQFILDAIKALEGSSDFILVQRPTTRVDTNDFVSEKVELAPLGALDSLDLFLKNVPLQNVLDIANEGSSGMWNDSESFRDALARKLEQSPYLAKFDRARNNPSEVLRLFEAAP